MSEPDWRAMGDPLNDRLPPKRTAASMQCAHRDRALAALDVIDRHHMAIERRTGAATPRTNPIVDRAYRELGSALDALYGPLPEQVYGPQLI